MAIFICETCGTHVQCDSEPPRCRICTDERQYVGWAGQRWLSPLDMQMRHGIRLERDGSLLGLGVAPAFAIDQRALVLPTDAGNILWECVGLVTGEAIDALRQLGGISHLAISHPHFYGAMAEWSEALGDVPILIHANDTEWLQCDTRNVRAWTGSTLRLSPTVTLIHCGGHFAGSVALHWSAGPTPGGALFPGDALQVVLDRRHVTFMYSYPNYIPMKPSAIRHIGRQLAPFDFADVYGFTWGRNILGGGREAVDASFARHFSAMEMTWP
jgi:hypothetical protein